MNGKKYSNILTKSFPASKVDRSTAKKWFYWFCAFWLMVAGLEFIQNYISTLLNDNPFLFLKSASYKLFWVIFIPFSVILGYSLKKARLYFAGANYWACNILLIVVITSLHLIIFSSLLWGISFLVHYNPWDIFTLITEKFSTRLYIGLSVYAVIALIYFHLKDKEFSRDPRQPTASKTITVKNGQKYVPVRVDKIKWISSDGHYLNIYTSDKKHVVVESLKNIITSLPDNFKRIHRSTIVNINMISELKSRLTGDYDVILNDGEILRLSRNYTDSLKGMLL